MHLNYAYLLCTREWEKIVDLFTDDAMAILHRRGRFEGKEEIIKIFKEIVKNNRGRGRDGHLALQPIINVDGDKATAQWLMSIMILDSKGNMRTAGCMVGMMWNTSASTDSGKSDICSLHLTGPGKPGHTKN